MEDLDIDQVILNYLQGEATTNEIEFLRKWMSKNEDNETIFESVKTYWENSNLNITSSDVDSAYIKLKTLSFQQSPEHSINPFNKRRRKSRWYKYAAVFIVFFTIVGMIYFANDSEEQKHENSFVQEVIKVNPKGQKLTTFLPDGSKVILNSQSKIKYHRPFNETERLIELDGEAYFEVKKDDQKPFRVLANGVSTTALGTSFNVNSKIRNVVEVALVSGKVRVSKSLDQSIVLSPGKSTRVNKYGKFEILEFDPVEKVGWIDGVLIFKNNTLSEIIARLEDWYGVNFITIGELENDFHYSGNFKNEALEEVLIGISFVHHLEFKISADTVKIYSNSKM